MRAERKTTKWGVSPARLATHLALALLTIVGCLVAVVFDRSAVLAEPLSLGLGYIGLLYIGASLLIGPLYLARQRRNPVNLYIRRDVGIWAGITSLLHVVLGLQIFEQGQILLYFFRQVQGHYLPQLDLFGLSNWVGLLAAVIVLVLLVLSNDWSLRRLKGKRWKGIQRWTYPLIVLAILHTFGYQITNTRDAPYILAVVGFTLILAIGQGTGALVYLQRQSRRLRPAAGAHSPGNGATIPAARRPSPAAPNPYLLPPADESGLSRRRFLLYGGATLLASLAGLVSFRVSEEIVGQMVRDGALRGANPPAAAPAAPTAEQPSPTTPPDAAAALPPPATTPPDAPSAPAPPTTTPDTNSADALPTAPPAPTAPPTAPPTADAGSSPGTVLATLAACPLNSALNFTTPDTGDTGILVHEPDGSVRAFSNLCTHRPYPVQYDAGSQTFVCPLHLARFDAMTGDVTAGPARSALPIIPVHLDGKGNIIYG